MRAKQMLRIEREVKGCVTRLRLSGRVQADGIGCIRSAMSDDCARKILDLSDVTLIDRTAVGFLIRCEDAGVELVNSPPYVREWIHRERAEEAERQTV